MNKPITRRKSQLNLYLKKQQERLTKPDTKKPPKGQSRKNKAEFNEHIQNQINKYDLQSSTKHYNKSQQNQNKNILNNIGQQKKPSGLLSSKSQCVSSSKLPKDKTLTRKQSKKSLSKTKSQAQLPRSKSHDKKFEKYPLAYYSKRQQQEKNNFIKQKFFSHNLHKQEQIEIEKPIKMEFETIKSKQKSINLIKPQKQTQKKQKKSISKNNIHKKSIASNSKKSTEIPIQKQKQKKKVKKQRMQDKILEKISKSKEQVVKLQLQLQKQAKIHQAFKKYQQNTSQSQDDSSIKVQKLKTEGFISQKQYKSSIYQQQFYYEKQEKRLSTQQDATSYNQKLSSFAYKLPIKTLNSNYQQRVNLQKIQFNIKQPSSRNTSHQNSPARVQKWKQLLVSLLGEDSLQPEIKDKIKMAMSQVTIQQQKNKTPSQIIQSQNKNHQVVQAIQIEPDSQEGTFIQNSSEKKSESRKQEYIEHKMQAQILSEKQFNSPRNSSPRASPRNFFQFKHITQQNQKSSKQKPFHLYEIKQVKKSATFFNSPTFASPKLLVLSRSKEETQNIQKEQLALNQNTEQKQEVKQQIENKTVEKNETIQQTIKTTNVQQNQDNVLTFTPNSNQKKKQTLPFEVTFEFVQEFCIIIFNYFAQDFAQRRQFLKRIKQSQNFVLKMVLKHQEPILVSSSFIENQMEIPLFFFLQQYKVPVIFTNQLVSQLLNRQPMKQLLENSNYHNLGQQSAQSAYLKLLIHSLQQAAYKKSKRFPALIQSHNINQEKGEIGLFNFIITQIVQLIRDWTYFRCGDLKTQGDQQAFEVHNQRKYQELIKNYVQDEQDNKKNNSHFSWVLYQIAQLLLIEEIEEMGKILYNLV